MSTWSVRGPDRLLLVCQRLRERRHRLGLTQLQVVARLARCGVHTTNKTLSSLEHGAGIDVGRLPELATALDCTVTYLLGLTEDPSSWEPDPEQAPPARSGWHDLDSTPTPGQVDVWSLGRLSRRSGVRAPASDADGAGDADAAGRNR